MPRPRLQRIISAQPVVTVYKPVGVPVGSLEWVNLTLDEFEAIRLIDDEGLDQEAAAGQMGISRPTVTRILASARGKIARFLTHGHALLIQGGPVIPPAGRGPGRGGGFGRGRGGRGGRGRGRMGI